MERFSRLQWEYQSDSIICQQSGGCGTVLVRRHLNYPYNNIVSDCSSPLHSSNRAMKMGFDRSTRSLLERYTSSPESDRLEWPLDEFSLNAIPSFARLHGRPQETEGPFSDFILDVVKDIHPTDTLRTVLIVEIKDPHN